MIVTFTSETMPWKITLTNIYDNTKRTSYKSTTEYLSFEDEVWKPEYYWKNDKMQKLF